MQNDALVREAELSSSVAPDRKELRYALRAARLYAARPTYTGSQSKTAKA